MVKPGEALAPNDAFKYNGKDAMSVELAADRVKVIFKPFEVLLGGYVW